MDTVSLFAVATTMIKDCLPNGTDEGRGIPRPSPSDCSQARCECRDPRTVWNGTRKAWICDDCGKPANMNVQTVLVQVDAHSRNEAIGIAHEDAIKRLPEHHIFSTACIEIKLNLQLNAHPHGRAPARTVKGDVGQSDSICLSCRRANVSCPIYPQDAQHCVAYVPNTECTIGVRT